MKRRILPLIIAIFLMFCMNISVCAHEVPELKNGTISFSIYWKEEPLNDGSLTIYRVGDIVENDGNYSFALIEKLKASNISLKNIEDSKLAKTLAERVKEKGIDGTTVSIKDGKAYFKDVVPGLYVVVQNKASSGFETMSPFLISMPRFEDGSYKNEIKAKPKVSLKKEPEESPKEEPSQPPKIPNATLPQTGQLNWPVPILAVLGMALFGFGWILYFRKKKDIYEN